MCMCSDRCGNLLSVRGARICTASHMHALIWNSIDWETVDRVVAWRLKWSSTGLKEIAELSCSGCRLCRATRDRALSAPLIVINPAA